MIKRTKWIKIRFTSFGLLYVTELKKVIEFYISYVLSCVIIAFELGRRGIVIHIHAKFYIAREESDHIHAKYYIDREKSLL